MPVETVTGTTLAVKIAGFLGACTSLLFAKVLKPVYAASSVLAGAAFAHYGVQATVWYWPDVHPVQEPIAFLIGLLGMNMAGWLLSRFPRFLDDRFGIKAVDAEDAAPAASAQAGNPGGPDR